MGIKKRFVFIFLCIFFVSLFAVTAFCADNYSANIGLINDRCERLNAIMDTYAEQDSSDGKGVAIRTSTVIVEYYNEINKLRGDERVSKDDLYATIELLYLKGRISGECAWIYESHIGDICESGVARVKEKYSKILGDISSHNDIESILACEDGYTGDISVAVYTEKIYMLYTSEDSAEVAVIAIGAIEDINSIAKGELAGISYEEVYQRARDDISVQRIREGAVESFCQIYDKIYGEGSYLSNSSSDKNIVYFLYSVKKSSETAQFNANIKDSVFNVLGDVFGESTGEYSDKFLKSLKDDIEVRVGLADKSGSVVEIAFVFDGFDINFERARTKDALVSYMRVLEYPLSEDIANGILNEYNADGGIFDGCSGKEKLTFEFERAKLRVEWAQSLAECEEKALMIFGDIDFSDAKQRIDALYAPNDEKIKNASDLEEALRELECARVLADTLLSDFEVEVYLIKYDDILQKSAEDIELGEKEIILDALLDFDLLGDSAKSQLSEEIFDISEKYKRVCILQIYLDYLGEYPDVFEDYSDLTEQTEFSSVEDFIADIELIIKKTIVSAEMCNIYERYFSLSQSVSLSDNYITALLSQKENYLKLVYDAERPDDSMMSEAVLELELELCRVYSIGKIELLSASGDSEAVRDLIEGKKTLAKSAQSIGELDNIVDDAVLAVYKLRVSETLFDKMTEIKSDMLGFKYLKSSEKDEMDTLLFSKYELALEDIESASSEKETDEIYESTKRYFEQIYAEATALDLSACAEAYRDSLVAQKNDVLIKIRALGYLSEREIAEIEDKFSSQINDAVLKFSQCEDVGAIQEESVLAERGFAQIYAEAEALNIENARESVSNKIYEKFQTYRTGDYTAENYKLIHDAYNHAISNLELSDEIDEFISIMEQVYKDMAGVVSIFEDTRAEMQKELKEAYENLEAFSARYSKDRFAQLQGIYLKTMDEIKSAHSSMGYDELKRLTADRIAAMRAIKTEWISSGGLSSESKGNIGYPAGYDILREGLWGIVYNKGGLESDIRLNITMKDAEGHHTSALKSAVKNSLVSYVGEIPMTNEEISDILDDCEIKKIFDIKLVRDNAIYDSFSGTYKIKILLPSELREIRDLKVVYLFDDGKAEYYDATCDGGFLIFESTHFSEFLIVGEKQVDLSALIIILGIFAIIECFALMILKFLSEGEKNALMGVMAMPPLMIVAPQGGVAISVILAAIDIAIGIYIAILSVRLMRARRDNIEPFVTAGEDIRDFGDEYQGEIYGSAVGDECGIEENTEGGLPQIENKRAAMPCLPALLDSVSAEEADSLISDNNVASMVVISQTNSGICRGCKKTFINIDTISDNFSAGDTVSLKELKERRLIPQSACYIKVLARGVLDKPLVIKAQSFSNNAIKMIALTGGTAVLEGGSEI